VALSPLPKARVVAVELPVGLTVSVAPSNVNLDSPLIPDPVAVRT
jgi:hypothetical protein